MGEDVSADQEAADEFQTPLKVYARTGFNSKCPIPPKKKMPQKIFISEHQDLMQEGIG